MDPLFERRELVRNIHIEAKYLQRNIHASLLAQLRMKFEGICVSEGYIQRRSITIIEHSLGRTNLIKGGLDYAVRFQADMCLPHQGQIFRAPVSMKSKIGIHAELNPLKVLLPRDIHIGNGEFDEIEEKEEVEFEIVGARFQQGDESIVVLGKLRTVVQAAPLDAMGSSPDVVEPMMAAPMADGSAKKMVTVTVESTKLGGSDPTRRKRIRANGAGSTNEPNPQGTT